MSQAVTFRYVPLPVWQEPTPDWRRRSSATFRAPLEATLAVLRDEVGRLTRFGPHPAKPTIKIPIDTEVTIMVGFGATAIRRDGRGLLAGAGHPAHPGVAVNFDSRHGRLYYRTDTHEMWQHNLRAIALALAALRAVDRYGVSSEGEQYAGWAQLGTAPATDPVAGRHDLSLDLAYSAAIDLVNAHCTVHPDGRVPLTERNPKGLERCFRSARFAVHPDRNGGANHDLFLRLEAAGRILGLVK